MYLFCILLWYSIVINSTKPQIHSKAVPKVSIWRFWLRLTMVIINSPHREAELKASKQLNFFNFKSWLSKWPLTRLHINSWRSSRRRGRPLTGGRWSRHWRRGGGRWRIRTSKRKGWIWTRWWRWSPWRLPGWLGWSGRNERLIVNSFRYRGRWLWTRRVFGWSGWGVGVCSVLAKWLW